jgi:hypothetical protein
MTPATATTITPGDVVLWRVDLEDGHQYVRIGVVKCLAACGRSVRTEEGCMQPVADCWKLPALPRWPRLGGGLNRREMFQRLTTEEAAPVLAEIGVELSDSLQFWDIAN